VLLLIVVDDCLWEGTRVLRSFNWEGRTFERQALATLATLRSNDVGASVLSRCPRFQPWRRIDAGSPDYPRRDNLP